MRKRTIAANERIALITMIFLEAEYDRFLTIMTPNIIRIIEEVRINIGIIRRYRRNFKNID